MILLSQSVHCTKIVEIPSGFASIVFVIFFLIEKYPAFGVATNASFSLMNAC